MIDMSGSPVASAGEGETPPTRPSALFGPFLIVCIIAMLTVAALAAIASSDASADTDGTEEELMQCKPQSYKYPDLDPAKNTPRFVSYAGKTISYDLRLPEGHILKWEIIGFPGLENHIDVELVQDEEKKDKWTAKMTAEFSGYVYRVNFYDGTDPSWEPKNTFWIDYDVRRHCNLVFDAQGGYPTPSTIENDLEQWTIGSDIPYKSGYRFKGWCLDPDGKGTLYNSGDRLEYDDRSTVDPYYVKVYAIWSNHYEIVLDSNGGRCDFTKIEVPLGGTCTLPNASKETIVADGERTRTRTAFDFTGWYSDDTLVGRADEACTPVDDMVLKAGWSSFDSVTNLFILSFDLNGGSGTFPDIIGDSTEDRFEVNLSGDAPMLEKHDFLGWDDGSNVIRENSIYMISPGKTVLTAAWEQSKAPFDGTPDESCIVGEMWSFTPILDEGSSISVSGSDWISVDGTTLHGIPPSEGMWSFVLTVSCDGYLDRTVEMEIEAVSKLAFLSSPLGGAIAYAL